MNYADNLVVWVGLGIYKTSRFQTSFCACWNVSPQNKDKNPLPLYPEKQVLEIAKENGN